MRSTVAIFNLEPGSTFGSQQELLHVVFNRIRRLVTKAHGVLSKKCEERQFRRHHCKPVACQINL
jgi:hypothetical protein